MTRMDTSLKLKGLRRRLATGVPWLAYSMRVSRGMLASARRRRKGLSPSCALPSRIISVEGFRNCFSGYYDHSPFCPGNENLLLLHATNASSLRRPTPEIPVQICLFDHTTNKLVQILGESYAWNWQQGSRLNWLDEDTFAFNVYDGSSQDYRTLLGRLSAGSSEMLPIALQEFDKTGRIYSISYAALAKFRPDYGYRNRPVTEADIKENRIQSYNRKTGELTEHVTAEALIELTSLEWGISATRAKFNHLLASPSGKGLVFLFRYFSGQNRITDLYFLDPETNQCACLLHNANVSHYCWHGDRNLILTGDPGQGFGYYDMDLDTRRSRKLVSGEDGHPSILLGGVVADTYPDHYGFRHLKWSPKVSGIEWTRLASFVEPEFFSGETRCDLHPGVSGGGRWLKLDCASGHQRRVAILDLGELENSLGEEYEEGVYGVF